MPCGQEASNKWRSDTLNMSELVDLLIWLIYNNSIIKSTKECELISTLQICDEKQGSSTIKENSMVVDTICAHMVVSRTDHSCIINLIFTGTDK